MDTHATVGTELVFQAATSLEAGTLAFQTSGNKAAVFQPRFGQAHQQYFTPKWLTEAFYQIADGCFCASEKKRTLTVIDPTCGSGRLLAPFAREGHKTLGVELDARLVPTARRVVGKAGYVLQGDIVQYAPLLADLGYSSSFNVIVTNPPYGLWWELPEAARENYELTAKSGQIESQAMILDLAAQMGNDRNTLLIGLFSGRFFQNNGHVLRFVKRHFQVVALLNLPRPFKKEYGIDVDAALLVGYKVYEHTDKHPVPLTGEWTGGQNPDGLAGAVVEAFVDLNPNKHYTGKPYESRIYHLSAHQTLAQIPRLEMAVRVETTTAPVRLRKGIAPQSEWAGAWRKFYAHLPTVDFSVAEGANADVMQAYGALPNVLIRGVEETVSLLDGLGFEVQMDEHDQARIERLAHRYRWERLPLRELHPAEYLAWYEDGEMEAKADVVIPGVGEDGADVEIAAGQTYTLRVRWERQADVAQKDKCTGRDRKGRVQEGVAKTWIDRGYLVFRLWPEKDPSQEITVKEVETKQIEAFVQAFPLPEVSTVAEVPQYNSWAVQLERLCDEVEARCGYRLYAQQFEDVSCLAVQKRIGLLYEQGGGKTTALFHWATLRGYRRTLLVTPAQVVGGIIEDMTKWGFAVERLTHGKVSRIQAELRARRAFWRKRHDSAARVQSIRRKLERLDESPPDLGGASVSELRDRLLAEAAAHESVLATYRERESVQGWLARKRRHLRNLLDISAKGKGGATIDDEIAETETEVAELEQQLEALPQPPFSEEVSRFWVCSYQDLSLGSGVYDTWEHHHYDKEGTYLGSSSQNGAKCEQPGCRGRRAQEVTKCPKCGEPWHSGRGSDRGGARHCRECGTIAWTQGALTVRQAKAYRLREGDSVESLQARYGVTLADLRAANPRLAGKAVRVGTPIIIPARVIQANHHCPMGYRVKHLFSAAILDEAQDSKSKGTLAGETTRALHTRGRALATGTLIGGYVTDLFWNVGWLVGQGFPLWPFPWKGGAARFLAQFGTYKWITKEFADSLQTGQRHLIPSVSNLGRLWRLLSGFSLRREKDELLDDLPPKHREVHWVDLDDAHAGIYDAVEGWAEEEITKAGHVAKKNPQAAMGRIGRALWKTRYCASTATRNGWPFFADVLSSDDGEGGLPGHPAKVEKALEILEDVRKAGEKALVFSSLNGLHRDTAAGLTAAGIGFYDLKAVGNNTSKRLEAVRRFERDPGATVLLAGTKMLNRGVTIVEANHVLILNLEWSPEPTVQAEDRIHRPGQERACYIHYILSAHTMEEGMNALVLDKRDTQVAVLDRRTKNQSVQEVLRDAVPLKARLARDLVKHRARRQAERAEPRERVQKPVVRRRPSAPADAGDQWARLRAQMKREAPVRQGITPKPTETHQPALFTM